MKRLGLAAAGCLVGMLTAPASAQRIMIQPEVGINFGNVSDLDAALSEVGIDTKMRAGFLAGVGVTFGLNERFNIGAGGYYSQQGVKFTASGEADATLKLDYIQVPVTLGVGFPTGGSVTPFVFAGPMIGFKASCKAAESGVSIDCPELGLDVKGTDFSILFGGGLGFTAGTGMISLGAWYDLGLTTILDNTVSGGPQPKNRVFGFGLGYSFPLGGRM